MDDVVAEHSQLVLAHPAVVWSLLTTPENISRWYAFDGAACDPVPGGRLEFYWKEHGWFFGTVLEADVPVEFRYRCAAEPETEPTRGASTVVAFRLTQVPGGTRVQVRETGFEEIAGSYSQARELAAQNLQAWRTGLTLLSDLARTAR